MMCVSIGGAGGEFEWDGVLHAKFTVENVAMLDFH